MLIDVGYWLEDWIIEKPAPTVSPFCTLRWKVQQGTGWGLALVAYLSVASSLELTATWRYARRFHMLKQNSSGIYILMAQFCLDKSSHNTCHFPPLAQLPLHLMGKPWWVHIASQRKSADFLKLKCIIYLLSCFHLYFTYIQISWSHRYWVCASGPHHPDYNEYPHSIGCKVWPSINISMPIYILYTNSTHESCNRVVKLNLVQGLNKKSKIRSICGQKQFGWEAVRKKKSFLFWLIIK